MGGKNEKKKAVGGMWKVGIGGSTSVTQVRFNCLAVKVRYVIRKLLLIFYELMRTWVTKYSGHQFGSLQTALLCGTFHEIKKARQRNVNIFKLDGYKNPLLIWKIFFGSVVQ